jgi:ABC-type multidrug transport system fused ATPase/permease subunit
MSETALEKLHAQIQDPDQRIALSGYTRYLSIFHRYAGAKLYLVLFIVLLGGVIEVFGITLLLPILELSQDGGQTTKFTRQIAQWLESVGAKPNTTTLLILMVGIFTLKGVIVFWQKYTIEKLAAELTRSLQYRLTDDLSTVGYSLFVELESGTLANLLFRETERFTACFLRFVALTSTVISVTIYFAVAASLSIEITAAIIMVGAIVFFGLRGIVRRTRKLSIETTKRYGQTQSLVLQMLGGFLYLKATSSISKVMPQIRSGFASIAEVNRATGLLSAGMQAIIEPLAVILLAALVFYQVVIQQGEVAEVLILALLFYRAFGQVMTIQLEWQKFNRSLGGVAIVEAYRTALEENREVTGETSVENIHADIELRNVTYQYKDRPAAKNIDLVLNANSSVGIIGGSGAGKSTLFLLIAGVLKPTEGSIHLGGRNYADLDSDTLRRKIGFVTQDPVLLNDSIANNISLWDCDASDPDCRARIERAAEMADCRDFIDQMPDRFDTIVGERGASLSGGQRQRIAIARELYKDPGLIIFDEATSALDTQSERQVQNSIDKLKGERTILIVAHRLSTVRNCDRIVVMSEGRIAEVGTYEELASNTDSHFHALLQAQKI